MCSQENRKSEIIQEITAREAKMVLAFKMGEAKNPWDGRGTVDLSLEERWVWHTKVDAE